jgi:CubicO group peptidase (beta-lactamase class C family)
MRVLTLGIALLASACASTPEPALPEPPAAIADNAQTWLTQHQVASVSIAAIEDGRFAWVAAYGERAPGRVATPDTPYNVASLAKPVSAETILRLVSAGRLSLDAPMSAHWIDPDIAADPRRDQLTLRVALSHRTGFPNWRRMTDGVLRFTSAPGEGFTYSGEGYEYARRYTQAARNESFEQLATDLVLRPVGMTSTSYVRQPWFTDRIARPYVEDGSVGDPSINEPGDMLASDDLYTTAADYARFVISVMNNEGVSPEIARERLEYTTDLRGDDCAGLSREECPTSIGMGMGWMVFRYEGETIITHSGSDSGEQALAFFIPERRAGLVIITNSANGRRIFPDIAEALYPGLKFNAVLRMQAG